MRLRQNLVAMCSVALALAFSPAEAAQDQSPPLPPPRPDTSAPADAAETAKPEKDSKEQGASADEQKPAEQRKAAEENADDAACIERITRLGLRFEKQPPVHEDECAIRNPVLVSALPNGVELNPSSLMTCPLAEELARWTSDVVVKEAEKHFQSAPTKLLIGTSYQCRAQRSGGKLSEHAYGNGVDIMGFEFAKRPPLTVSSQTDGSPEAAFQSAIRTGACPIFTTVLGPGSDEAHSDHLHLDLRERKGDYRICQ